MQNNEPLPTLMYQIALYIILSRDVPILKSFSAGRPKFFLVAPVVVLLLQRWLNYRGLLSAAKTEGENKESPTELFFSNIKGKT